MRFSLDPTLRALHTQGRALGGETGARSRTLRKQTEVDLKDIFRALGNAGMLAAPWAAQSGGLGLGPIELGSLLDGFGEGGGDAPVASAWATHTGLCGMALSLFGTPEQQQRYLPKMATGEWVAAWAASEALVDFDGSSIAMVAQRCGNQFRLQGKKPLVLNASIAHHFIVMAVTNPAAGLGGISCFVVEHDNPGVTVGDSGAKAVAAQSGAAASLVLRDCMVSQSARLGREGGAVDEIWPRVRSWLTCAFHTYWVGMMAASIEASVKHARQSGTGVRSQMVRKDLVDMQMRHRQARLLSYRAAQSLQLGDRRAGLHGAVAELFRQNAAAQTFRNAARIAPRMVTGECEHRRRLHALEEPPNLVGDCQRLRAMIAGAMLDLG